MRRITLLLTLLTLTAGLAGPIHADWSQFGGPRRDFSLGAAPRVADWGAAGPRKLWGRELGPGYSALVTDADGRRLFTQSRDGEEELVVALDAASGEILWEHRYAAPVKDLRGVDMAYGNAPQATPLLISGRLIGLGFTGVLWAVDAADGTPLWSKQLGKELSIRIPYFGHASSPLWVPATEGNGGSVVVLAGGALAFDPATGESRWQNREFGASYASPILADTKFGRQIIAAGAGDIVGLDPADGRLLWRHEYRNQHGTILGTPLLISDDLLFVSTYFLGSRGLRLVARNRVEQVWEQPDFQVSHFNVIRDGDTVYTTYRRHLLALDARSGEIQWRERGVGSANLLQAGDRSLLLGENGELALIELGHGGLNRLQSTRLLKDRSWTPPTILDDRLYVRDQHLVAAFDLNASGVADGGSKEAELELPEAFEKAVIELEAAARRAELEAIEEGVERFTAWSEDPRLGTWAAYYRGFGYWILSWAAPQERRLSFLDQAVEAEKRAVELDRDNAEAHALLGNLYSAYYRLAPQRASVVGPLGDEHLARALALEPENPRAKAIQALDLVYSPPQWGGDPVAGRKLLSEVVENSEIDPTARPQDARPTWLPAMARAWLAGLLLNQESPQTEPARKLLDEVLEVYPDHAMAARLHAGLQDVSSGAREAPRGGSGNGGSS